MPSIVNLDDAINIANQYLQHGLGYCKFLLIQSLWGTDDWNPLKVLSIIIGRQRTNCSDNNIESQTPSLINQKNKMVTLCNCVTPMQFLSQLEEL